MKKLICLTLSALFLLSSTACGEEKDNSEPADSSVTASVESEASTPTPTTEIDVDEIIGEEQNNIYIFTTPAFELEQDFVFDFNGRQLPVHFDFYSNSEEYIHRDKPPLNERTTSKTITLGEKEYRFDEINQTIVYTFPDERLNEINTGKNFILYSNQASNYSATICNETGILESFDISRPQDHCDTDNINPDIAEDELKSIAAEFLSDIYGKEYLDNLTFYSVNAYKSHGDFVEYRIKYNYNILGTKAFEVTVYIGNDGGVTALYSDYALQMLYKTIITEERIQKALDIVKGLMEHLGYSPYRDELTMYINILPDGSPALRVPCSSGIIDKQKVLKNVYITLI